MSPVLHTGAMHDPVSAATHVSVAAIVFSCIPRRLRCRKQGSNGYPAITDLYLYALPRIWAACRDCILLIEGEPNSTVECDSHCTVRPLCVRCTGARGKAHTAFMVCMTHRNTKGVSHHIYYWFSFLARNSYTYPLKVPFAAVRVTSAKSFAACRHWPERARRHMVRLQMTRVLPC